MNLELKNLLSQHEELSEKQIDLILRFYDELVLENEKQNLTRLTKPQDFYEGHFLDVLHLLKSQFLAYPALDLGSGCGVPGLLAALVDDQASAPGLFWILSDSERKKAEYLQRTVDTLGLNKQIQVSSERGEVLLRSQKVASIVARAVGPISRIYPWLRRVRGPKKCSTWNIFILFKGPAWDEEWKIFQEGPYKNELKIIADYSYEVGAERKKRKILKLSRL